MLAVDEDDESQPDSEWFHPDAGIERLPQKGRTTSAAIRGGRVFEIGGRRIEDRCAEGAAGAKVECDNSAPDLEPQWGNGMSAMEPTVAAQTVTPDGRSVQPLIEGIRIHHPTTHQDERGTLCEIYSRAWKFDDVPLVHAYLVTVRPRKVKGWAIHQTQIDRYFFVQGSLKVVLYDAREGSPTHGMINERVFSEANRALLSVPPLVYHAVENVGETDGLLFNIPSDPYDYEKPDKLTLPLVNDLIPYSFEPARGY